MPFCWFCHEAAHFNTQDVEDHREKKEEHNMPLNVNLKPSQMPIDAFFIV